MFNKFASVLYFPLFGITGIYLGYASLNNPNTGAGVIAGLASAMFFFWLVVREPFEQRFLLKLFWGGLALRWLLGAVIYSRSLYSLAPDALTYDYFGNYLCQIWLGKISTSWAGFIDLKRSGWGMYYYVGSIYYVFGRSSLAIQLIDGAMGAYTAVLVYKITMLVYPQLRVARMAGIMAAVAPSMVLWTAQGIKEAPIMLCLAVSAYCALRLCRSFEFSVALFLLAALLSLYSLRNYVFYITFVSIVATLLFSTMKFSSVRAVQGFILCIILGVAFIYLGAPKIAQQNFDLKRIQAGREWGARAADSGYGGDVDITDAPSALAYLPLGIVYFLFGPFPWMVRKMSQAITLPEMVVWWAVTPLLVRGYWFALRRRLLEMLPLCAFTFGLTVVYAFLQTNVGTAHRQRTQIYIFFFIFISIGWEQWQLSRQQKRQPLAAPPKPVHIQAQPYSPPVAS
jgi:hypothetical protein